MIEKRGESWCWARALTPTWSWRNLMYSMVSWSTDAVSVCTRIERNKIEFVCVCVNPVDLERIESRKRRSSFAGKREMLKHSSKH
jgi:hypothetical protein